MRGATYDPANMNRADQLGIKRIGDIVLAHLSRAPAGSVEKTIVDGKIDVGEQRRHGLEALEQRRQLARIGWLGGNLNDFLDFKFSVRSSVASIRAMPQPDRTGKILQRCHHTDKTVSLRRIVRRAQLKHHLLFRTQVQALKVTPLAEIPDVQAVPVLAAQQQFRIHAVSLPCSACPTRW